MARDFGENYLNSTLPNAIIMNYGDNDTFPLWYAQEVEGVRKDVRVMNMSYLGAEWYIDQMRIKSNDSDPLPFSLPRSKYTYRNETVLIQELFNRPIPAKQLIEWIASEDPRTMLPMTSGEKMDFLPSRQIAIPVNKQNAIESGIVKPEDAHLMVDTVYLNINPNKPLSDAGRADADRPAGQFRLEAADLLHAILLPRVARSEGLSATRRLRIPFRADPDAQRAG